MCWALALLNIVQREPKVGGQIKPWEISETWDHIQWSGFLNLAQNSN